MAPMSLQMQPHLFFQTRNSHGMRLRCVSTFSVETIYTRILQVNEWNANIDDVLA